MFKSTNELYGTSYKSRIDDPKYQFAGKTGTAQLKKITKEDRELDLEIEQIPYKEIAGILGIPLGTVKSHLHTAVGTFAQRWKGNHGPGDRVSARSKD